MVSILLLGFFDVSFGGLSLLEIGMWVGIGFFLGLTGFGVVVVFFIAYALSKGKKLQLIRGSKTRDYSLGEMAEIALFEEVICRGPLLIVLLIWTLPTMVWAILIIIDGILFGLAHFIQRVFSVSDFIMLSWMGVIFSGSVIKNGSLIPSIFLHLLLLVFLRILHRFLPIVLIASDPEN
jgi:hypothetical protein